MPMDFEHLEVLGWVLVFALFGIVDVYILLRKGKR